MATEEQFQQQVIKKLSHLDEDMEFLKKKITTLAMIIEDSTLTEDEMRLLKETAEDMEAGKLIPFDKIKKELNL